MPWLGLLGFAFVMAGCASPGPTDAARGEGAISLQSITHNLLITPEPNQAWELFALPGKRTVPFELATIQGRTALRVQADRSVSILRQRFANPVASAGELAFSWKIDALPDGADLRDAQAEDSPVRVVLAFGGDRSRLSARAHRLSELSKLVTGEDLPFATLSYVWSASEPLETVVNNPRTDRIRKLVVASGSSQLGRWLDYRRDVRADFVRAFGEEPGPLLAIALMTDTDNTESALQAWYGALQLQPAVTSPPALPAGPKPPVMDKGPASSGPPG